MGIHHATAEYVSVRLKVTVILLIKFRLPFNFVVVAPLRHVPVLREAHVVAQPLQLDEECEWS